MEDNLNLWIMEVNFNLQVNGRRPQFRRGWKTTSISSWMEDDLNFWGKMGDDLNFLKNGRQPQFFEKIGDNLNFMAKWKIKSFFKQN